MVNNSLGLTYGLVSWERHNLDLCDLKKLAHFLSTHC